VNPTLSPIAANRRLFEVDTDTMSASPLTQPTGARDRIKLLWQYFRKHIASWWWLHVMALGALALWFNTHYALGLNNGVSMPWRIYLVQKNAPFTRGDFITFRWHGAHPYTQGTVFGKQVLGMPGDTVSQIERRFTVAGADVGLAKKASRTGLPLAVGPTGVIPSGQYYVATEHVDSLDSRYALTGWIAREAIIGRIVWKW
jgi:conjugal transfer pilin signal peptidase TrbI